LARKIHPSDDNQNKNYSDFRKDEIDRQISIKSIPMTMVLEDSKGKNYLLNVMDTPGHLNFSDEVSTSLRISDGIILVVDVIEGLGLNSKNIIKEAIKSNLDIIICINKIDRIIIEVKLPPSDAYLKIKLLLDDINCVI